jgi:hypothetical protein
MLIKPDCEGRDDGYDNETFRYYENLSEDGYFYEVYILVGEKKAAVVVTEDGVSVDFLESGKTIHTNIVPKAVFSGHERLTWRQIAHILVVLSNTELEGRSYSKEEMDSLYEVWKQSTKDE